MAQKTKGSREAPLAIDSPLAGGNGHPLSGAAITLTIAHNCLCIKRKRLWQPFHKSFKHLVEISLGQKRDALVELLEAARR
jgi:hypothetical protein